MNLSIKNRYQAFFTRFLISLIILILFLYLMIYWWYPSPYFELDGGWDFLIILFLVDIILGPLLTLVVFKKEKRGLYFDLSIITCIQIVAIIYAGNIVYHEKPAFIVFAVDRFTLVSTRQINMRFLIDSDLLNNNSNGPIPVFTSIPEDINEKNNLMFDTIFNGAPDLEYRAEYYEPFLPNLNKVILRGKDIAKFYISDSNKKEIQYFFENNKLLEKDLSFYPVIGKKKDMLLAIHNLTGNIVGAIDIDPWVNN